MTDGERLEHLLRSALVPVEPPEALSDRLERTLSGLTEAAAEELADLDPAAMRDPRNWARPAAAAVVGTHGGRRARAGARAPAPAQARSRAACGRSRSASATRRATSSGACAASAARPGPARSPDDPARRSAA